RGVPLAPVIADSGDEDDLALLFRFRARGPGRPTLETVRVTSLVLPVDLGRTPLVWLGPADDGASLARLQALFAEAPTADLKEDLVTDVGLHGSSRAVVPLLDGWLRGDVPSEVRAQAAEWLGHHPDAAAVRGLAHAARQDPAARVREQAVKGLRINPFATATDSLLAQTASEGSDVDFQREVVEALASQRDPQALEAVARIAHAHSSADVRREAIERYAKVAAPESARLLLTDRLANDRSPAVQSEALRRLMALPGGIGIPAVTEAARAHPNPELRADARERLEENR